MKKIEFCNTALNNIFSVYEPVLMTNMAGEVMLVSSNAGNYSIERMAMIAMLRGIQIGLGGAHAVEDK